MILNNDNDILKHFEELRVSYPGLSIQECDEHFKIIGMLDFSALCKGIKIDDIFDVLIKVPKNFPEILPRVWEMGGRIPDDFHVLNDKSLCLGAELNIRLKLADSPSIITYIHELVIPYLYSYRYLELYGNLPYGELSHGAKGILEAYCEQFKTNSPEAAVKLLEALTKPYRGHHPCPCGSNLKSRICHGETMKRLRNSIPRKVFINDLSICKNQVYEKINQLIQSKV